MSSFTPIYKLKDWIDINQLNWNSLSENSNAIHLLEQYPDKIDWDELSSNPSIFKLNKDAMMLQIKDFAEDLAKVCFHPKRIERYLEKINYECSF